MRTTQTQINAVFERFCKATGNRKAEKWNDVGALQLDHNSIYGGYVIEKISNESGGISQPFGGQRRKGTEFCEVMWFAIQAVEEARKNADASVCPHANVDEYFGKCDDCGKEVCA